MRRVPDPAPAQGGCAGCGSLPGPPGWGACDRTAGKKKKKFEKENKQTALFTERNDLGQHIEVTIWMYEEEVNATNTRN